MYEETYKRLIICKFDLIKLLLHKQNLTIDQKKNICESLNYINVKLEEYKIKRNLKCEKLNQIEEFSKKIK